MVGGHSFSSSEAQNEGFTTALKCACCRHCSWEKKERVDRHGLTGQEQAQALGAIPAAPPLEDSPLITSAFTCDLRVIEQTEQPGQTGGIPKSWTLHTQVSRFLTFSQSRGAYNWDRGTFLGLVLLFLASNEPPVSQGTEGEKRVINALLLCSMSDTLHFLQPGSSSIFLVATKP